MSLYMYGSPEYAMYQASCAGDNTRLKEEFTCSICRDVCYQDQSTEHSLLLGTCRSQRCVQKRIDQLLATENALAKLKAEMKTAFLAIAVKAEFEAKGL